MRISDALGIGRSLFGQSLRAVGVRDLGTRYRIRDMGKPDRLRLRDLRRIFRIVGECCELGADPYLWRKHLASEAVRQIGARVGIAGELSADEPTGAGPAGPPGSREHVYLGFDDERDRLGYFRYIEDKGFRDDPFLERVGELMALGPGRRITCRREDAAPGRWWYRTQHYNRYHRPAGVDDGMISLHGLADADPPRLHFVVLRRELGAPRFSERDRQILDCLHAELGPLLGERLATGRSPSIADLPPRLREVLACLLDGATDKETALTLGLSPETVHDYVKTIYRHFGVRSRPKLLARWIRLRGRL